MSRRLDFVKTAKACIKKLASEFTSNPYNFFSESDMKCRLYKLMFQYRNINKLRPTKDGKMIHPLHSEVRYFNHDGRLLYQVDLSAVFPESTDVYSKPKTEGIKLAKGYYAPRCTFAIELKLNKRYKKRKMLDLWEKDMKKLSDIRTRNPSLVCFCILFDKKNQILEANETALLGTKYPGIELVYANADGYINYMNF